MSSIEIFGSVELSPDQRSFVEAVTREVGAYPGIATECALRKTVKNPGLELTAAELAQIHQMATAKQLPLPSLRAWTP
jgi:hypothetical protein